MYCGKCGAEIPKGNDFCVNCGTVISEKNSQNKSVSSTKKGHSIIIIATIMALIVVGIICYKVIIPSYKYNKAIESCRTLYAEAINFYDKKYFYEARDLFKQIDKYKGLIGSYEDTDAYLNSTPYKLEGTWSQGDSKSADIIYELEPEGKVKYGMLSNHTSEVEWDKLKKFQFGVYEILSVDDTAGGKLVMNDYIFGDRVIRMELYFVSKSTTYAK